jgi:hypothetical protein
MPSPTTSLSPSTPSVSPVSDTTPLTTATATPPHHNHHNHHHNNNHRQSTPPASTSASASTETLPLASSAPRNDRPASQSRPNHARRYTLSRFPLLRKGSRELARTHSTSSKSPADSLFHSTRPSRPSHSIARGPDPPAARELASSANHDGDVIAQEARSTPQTTRADRPDKMHQTSSRLLRMTDDERPYTRVSTRNLLLFSCLWSCHQLAAPAETSTCMACMNVML